MPEGFAAERICGEDAPTPAPAPASPQCERWDESGACGGLRCERGQGFLGRLAKVRAAMSRQEGFRTLPLPQRRTASAVAHRREASGKKHTPHTCSFCDAVCSAQQNMANNNTTTTTTRPRRTKPDPPPPAAPPPLPLRTPVLAAPKLNRSCLASGTLRLNEALLGCDSAIPEEGGGGGGGGVCILFDDVPADGAAPLGQALLEISKVGQELRQRVGCGAAPPERAPRLSFTERPQEVVVRAKRKRDLPKVGQHRLRPATAPLAKRNVVSPRSIPEPTPTTPTPEVVVPEVAPKYVFDTTAVHRRRVTEATVRALSRFNRLALAEERGRQTRKRKEVIEQALHAKMSNLSKQSEDKLQSSRANKARIAQCNRKAPQQKLWFILVAHAIPLRLWIHSARQQGEERKVRLREERAMGCIRRHFLHFLIKRRAKRARAEHTITQFIRMWRLRRIRFSTKKHALVILSFLSHQKEMGVVKQRVSIFLRDVRLTQRAVRKFILRRRAQLEMMCLQFDTVERAMVAVISKSTTLHDVTWLRKEVRQTALLKNIQPPGETAFELVTDAVTPFLHSEGTPELESSMLPKVEKVKKKKVKAKARAEPSLDDAFKKKCEQCIEVLARCGAEKLPEAQLAAVGEMTGLIIKKPYVRWELKRATLRRLVRQRSAQYQALLTQWAQQRAQQEQEFCLANARRLLDGDTTPATHTPAPHFPMFLDHSDMEEVVAQTRRSAGLLVHMS